MGALKVLVLQAPACEGSSLQAENPRADEPVQKLKILCGALLQPRYNRRGINAALTAGVPN